MPPTPPDVPGCRRCGTCCRRGGPVLHRADHGLVAEGHLPIAALVTLRPGEMVYDPVTGRAAPSETEAIKVRGCTARDWHCRFHDEAEGCRIYAHRPAQCRALQCWAPEALTALYTRERLTRADLLAAHAGVWELVREHSRRCDLQRLGALAARLGPDPETGAAIGAMLAYDRALRETLVESGRFRPEQLDFLLGRPLEEILGDFGLRLETGEGGRHRLARR